MRVRLRDADLGEDGGVWGGHGSFLGGEPSADAIGGDVHGGERRATEGVMDERGGESVTGADGVRDFYGEAGMLVE